MVKDLSDEDIYRLNRGGHDPYKVYAAYHKAVNSKGAPTVILALLPKAMEQDQEKLTILLIKSKNYRLKISNPLEIDLIYLYQIQKLKIFHMFDLQKILQKFNISKKQKKALGGFIPRRRTTSEDSKNAR